MDKIQTSQTWNYNDFTFKPQPYQLEFFKRFKTAMQEFHNLRELCIKTQIQHHANKLGISFDQAMKYVDYIKEYGTSPPIIFPRYGGHKIISLEKTIEVIFKEHPFQEEYDHYVI